MKPLYLEKSLGIDFQKEMVTTVLLGKTLRGMDLLDYHICYYGSNSSEESDKQFIENLSNLIKRNKLTNIRGAFCFPRNDIILKYIDIPAPAKEDIKAILEYEIEKHVPLNKDDIYYDFQIIKKKEVSLYNILIAASRKPQVDHFINLLKEASVIPSLISLSTVSNINLLSFNNYDQNIFNAVIEIGFLSVNISFILDGSVSFSKSAPIPENQNWRKCLSENAVSGDKLQTIAENFTEFLLKEINLSLVSYREIPSNKPIDCFYLSGGGLLARPVKKLLEQKISGTVHLLDPLAKFQKNDISEDDRNFLTNAIGTGIQNHIKNKFCINFLPASLRKYAKDHSFKTMLILTGVFMFLLLVIAFSIFLKTSSSLNKIENKLNKIKKEVIAADNMEREYEKIIRQKLTLQEIQINNPSRLRILKELTSLLPSDLWLSNLVIKQDAAEITGSADSTSKLVPLLEKANIFSDVHFIDSIKRIKNRERFKIKLPLKKMTTK